MNERSNSWLVAVLLVGVIGCPTPKTPLGHPRIRVHLTGIDDVGGKLTFTIDWKGQFVLESSTPTGDGKSSVDGCTGRLALEHVDPVFASFEAAELDGIKREYAEPGQADSRQRTKILYVRVHEVGHPRDQAEFERLDAQVDELLVEAWSHCPELRGR